jgi:hypothetical protein
VGTVDKFQGQEAPVVLHSITTSSPEHAPRALIFLFSLNRLNVATSRSQGFVIFVARARACWRRGVAPKQMRLVNAFCGAVRACGGVRDSWGRAVSRYAVRGGLVWARSNSDSRRAT